MNNTQHIEAYLTGQLEPADKLLTDARLLIDKDLQDTLIFQQHSYQLLQHYGRKKLKAEIEHVSSTLFSDKKFSGFKNTIFNIFKNKR